MRELPADFMLDGEGGSSHSNGSELKSIRLLDALHDVGRLVLLRNDSVALGNSLAFCSIGELATRAVSDHVAS
jgi:hypothetical protein